MTLFNRYKWLPLIISLITNQNQTSLFISTSIITKIYSNLPTEAASNHCSKPTPNPYMHTTVPRIVTSTF